MTKKQETLVIKVDWWLWRVVAMSGAITEVAKNRPVKVITSRPLVFRWNPYIKSVHWLDDRRLFEDVIKWNDYIELEPYTDPEFFNDARNRLYIACKKLWIECTEDKIPQPCLFLAEHEKHSNYLWCQSCNGKKILFQPFWSMWYNNDKSYRSLYVEHAQYIADELIKKWYEIYVVEREDQPRLKWCEAITTTDMRRVVSLADRYPLIWIDSCLQHCAKAFWKQALVIRAGTDRERYWYESHINMREKPMVAHTPLRLNMNDFNYDISNQYTNQFSNEFLDKVVDIFNQMYNRNLSCKECECKKQ